MNEKIIRLFKSGETTHRQKTDGSAEHYRDMIRKNLSYIESQCMRTIRLQMGKMYSFGAADFEIRIENEALELCNNVLDKLEESDFKILRQFQGKSKLTTYLTAIISRQAVDTIRKKRGRSREKERAKALGPLGEKIYKIIFQQGLSLVEVQKEFLHKRKPVPTDEAIQDAIDKIRGSVKIPADENELKTGYLEPSDNHLEKPSVVVPDSAGNPEKVLLQKTKEQEVERILTDLAAGLSGEERLILRMRFGLGENDNPKHIPDIASALNLNPKTVYKRIGNILTKCRNTLELKGVNINDLF